MIIEDRILKFEQMGFGIFIHYGLYSLLAQGEKPTLFLKSIDCNEYFNLPSKFSAENFDAHKIVQMAKDSGAKYIVLTARHHDGFSLYDTRGLNDYDAPHSLAERDLIGEFVDACNSAGISPFLYHTTLDLHQKSYNTDFHEYQKYLRKSIEILCKNYGKIGGFWFDGNWDKPEADWEEEELYRLIRKWQPEAMIINNSGIHNLGDMGNYELDCVTFEQHSAMEKSKMENQKYKASESCMTMNNHWGYAKNDFDYRSAPDFIEELCACRKGGANFLLNIGPKGDGSVPLMQQAILEEIGNWMDLFGEAIYRGRPSGIEGNGKNFGLFDMDDSVYLFFHDVKMDGDWNEFVETGRNGFGRQTFSNISRPIESIIWMDDGSTATFEQDINANTVIVNCPKYQYGVNFVVRVAKCKLK